MWLKDFEKVDVKINGYTLVLISELVANTPKDYNKFLSKIQTQLYTKEELRQMIRSKYHNYIDV